MADTLHLQIVTPDRLFVNEESEQVQIPGRNGELGILPGHAPLISELKIGEISYRAGTTTQYLAVAWGFAEVLPDKVTILADAAERAEEALRRAAADLDYEATLFALRRAEVRLEVAARAGQTTTTH